MREGFPRVRADLQAIGEAIKPAVSRVPGVITGLELAKALGIALVTGGAFEITRGRDKLMAAGKYRNQKKIAGGDIGRYRRVWLFEFRQEFLAVGILSFN